MGILAIILQIVNIFIAFPQIWSTIRDVIELIKLLRTPEEKAEAKAELKKTLVKYMSVNRKDKQQVSKESGNLMEDLKILKVKLQAKVAAV